MFTDSLFLQAGCVTGDVDVSRSFLHCRLQFFKVRKSGNIQTSGLCLLYSQTLWDLGSQEENNNWQDHWQSHSKFHWGDTGWYWHWAVRSEMSGTSPVLVHLHPTGNHCKSINSHISHPSTQSGSSVPQTPLHWDHNQHTTCYTSHVYVLMYYVNNKYLEV